MYYSSLKEFLKLSQRYNLIPIYKQVNADLDTPVSAFLKLGKSDYAFLLESVEGQEKLARYSFLGIDPELIFRSQGKTIQIIHQGEKKAYSLRGANHPLMEIKKIMRSFKAATVKGLPRFYGGFVGYLGYDIVRFFEDIPDKNKDDLALPDALFMLTRTVLVFDHLNHTIKIVENLRIPPQCPRQKLQALYQQAQRRIEGIAKRLRRNLAEKNKPRLRQSDRLKISSNFKKWEFARIVKQAKGYIKRGDIIQVVLSQRFKAKTKSSPFNIYRNLRRLNPSPYMFFLRLQDAALIGSSPEMLVRCEDGIIQTRPIAGTRPRGRKEEEDRKLERELLSSAKERAEHIMLVDLGRNDLGRVCKSGTVRVNEFMNVERYSHVMHLVSEVRGIMEKRYDAYDVLKACFPAGTVTGSPKIRAMEIIDALENIRRGPYAGCVGYFSFSQNMDTCITIRTIIVKNKHAYIQAGAGIVADSLPEKEYQESVNKARALFEAIAE